MPTKSAKLGVYSNNEIRAALCKKSFFHFVKTFWDVVVKREPVWNWHIKYLCDEIQKVAERVINNQPKEYDLAIAQPPSTTKSTVASIMFPAWFWTRMDTGRFICGSHTDSLVLDLSLKCRDIVNSELYSTLFPDIVLRKDQEAKGYWMNTKGGDRFSCTVGGKSPMGRHAHILIVDDPIDPQRVLSEVELNKANDWFDATLGSRTVDAQITPLILVQQRLHLNDPIGHFLEKTNKVKYICLPAEETEDIRPIELKEKYVDGLLDPVRLPKSVLVEKMTNNRYIYASQFLQNPIPPGGGLFKREWFNKFTDVIPANLKKIRAWDKAGSKDRGCYTCGILMGLDVASSVYYVIDEVRGQWESVERNKIIRSTAEMDGVQTRIWIEEEPGSGGKESAEISVKQLAGFIVNIDKVQKNKEARAEPLASQCAAGNVVLIKKNWVRDFVDELCVFPMGKYRDRVDASSCAFNHLTLHGTIDLHSALDSLIADRNASMVSIIPDKLPETEEVGVQFMNTYQEYYVWKMIGGNKKFIFSSESKGEALLAAMLHGVPVDVRLIEEVSEEKQQGIRDKLGFSQCSTT